MNEDINYQYVIDNYNYLKSLNIEEVELNRFVFGRQVNDEEQIREVIDENIEKEELNIRGIPIFNIEPTIENQLYLRDLYMEHLLLGIKPIINMNDIEYKNHLLIEDNYDILYDDEIRLFRDRELAPYFKYNSYQLFNLLNSINSSFYEIIIKNPPKVKEYIKSLNTIKNWDKDNSNNKYNYLKNELVSKLLYTAVEYTYNLIKDTSVSEDFFNSNGFLNKVKDIIFDEELLDTAINNKYNNDKILTKLMEYYPYSLDMFIYEKEKYDKYYSIAKENGYLLLNDRKNMNLSNDSYYKYNELLGNNFMDDQRREYLDRMQEYYNKYKKNKDELYINLFFLSLDTYLRKNLKLDDEINNYNELSHSVLNRSIEQNFTYYKILINKYKELLLQTSLSSILIEETTISTNAIRDKYFKNLNLLSDMYEYLIDKYEISLRKISYELSEGVNFRSTVKKYIEDNEDSINNKQLEKTDKLVEIIEGVALASVKYFNTNDKKMLNEMLEDAPNIITILNNIINLNPKVRDKMAIYSIEYELFNLEEFK